MVWDVVDEVTDIGHLIPDLDGLGGDISGRKEQRKKMNREFRRALGLQGMEGRSIYVGNNTIIHRDGGGFIAEVSPRQFIERMDGWNLAVTIFVSCRGNDPVGSREVAQRAR